jgi:hypothetical protein
MIITKNWVVMVTAICTYGNNITKTAALRMTLRMVMIMRMMMVAKYKR